MGRDMHWPDIPGDALSEQLEVYRTLSMGFWDRSADGGECLKQYYRRSQDSN